jgi:hypothetical protein
MRERIPCPCRGVEHCPICYGWGHVLKPAGGSSRSQPLPDGLREALIDHLNDAEDSWEERAAVAKRAGLSESTLIRAAKGGAVGMETLRKIAREMGVPGA